MSIRSFILTVCFVALAMPVQAKAQGLIADVSSHIINVRTDFTGAELLLFGALDAPLTENDDLLIALSGPANDVRVRESVRRGIFWVNSPPVDIRAAPRYFHLFWARDAAAKTQIAAVREQNRLGWNDLKWERSSEQDEETNNRFLKGFLNGMQQQGFYQEHIGAITFLGDRLFRASIAFAPNVPVGNYQVRVYLLRGGEITAAQSSNLLISKAGIGADIAFAAHQWPLLYGLGALLTALLCGLAGYGLFRRLH